MKQQLKGVLCALLAAAFIFSGVFTANTVSAQQLNNNQPSVEEMQTQIEELRTLINALVLALGNGAQPQTNQAGIPSISSQRARAIAVELVGHGIARDVMLFSENGVLMFEVEVIHETVRYMVYVNAINGGVIRMSRYEEGSQGITTLPDVVPGVTAPRPTPAPTPSPGPSATPNPSSGSSARPVNPAISRDAAIAIAARDLADRGLTGTLRSAAMDWEQNQWVWEVEFRDGRIEYEWYINVHTGAIIKFEMDR